MNVNYERPLSNTLLKYKTFSNALYVDKGVNDNKMLFNLGINKGVPFMPILECHFNDQTIKQSGRRSYSLS